MPDRKRWSWHEKHLATLLTISLVIVVRCQQVSGLTLPAWVDSVHHSAIVRLILAQGALPESYRPFAEVDQVYYHLGYHAVVAVLSRVSGFGVEQTMLWFGQALNVLACLVLYPLAKRWTGRQSAALLAVVVPGTLSLMPAYYVTWGRYTQLAGLVLLPLAMLAYLRAVEEGGKRTFAAAAMAAGMLFWVHYRVTFFFAAFVAAYLIYHAAAGGGVRRAMIWRRTAAVAGGALLVASPWLWRLWTTVLQPLETLGQRIRGTDEYNVIPLDILDRPGMSWPLVAAAIGALCALARGGALRRWASVTLLWMVVVALVLNPGLLGLRPTWIVNNASAVIALYVPEALLIALGLAAVVESFPRVRTDRADVVLQFLVVVLASVTAPSVAKVVNPVTVLVEQADLDAIQWIDRNTDPNARFLVNERHWQEQIYSGTDAGYWIPNLTGRRTTMPIILYSQGAPQYVQSVNELGRIIETSPDPEAPSFLATLRARGITHVYIGTKGGPLAPDRFLAGSHYRLAHRSGAAHVFEVKY